MSRKHPGLHVFESPAEAGQAVAAHVAEKASAAIAVRGGARIALSGGRSPQHAYRALAAPPLRGRVDWVRVRILFADERAVPPDHEDSNARLVRATLLAGLPAPGPELVRMRAETMPDEAALEAYEHELSAPLDLLLLGVGPDGHTASLFPGSPLLGERERRVAFVTGSPKPPPRRMTILPRVIEEARAVVVMVTGEDKARAVAEALEGDGDPAECPARLARGGAWYVDREAASRLTPA